MILKVLMVVSSVILYYYGEIYNKNFKYCLGIPISLLGVLYFHTLWPLLAILTYLGATELGYGDNNPLTKLVGKKWAIIIVGTALGLASYPIIGWACILGGFISGWAFGFLHVLDDADKIKEPWIAILRGLMGTICLLF